MSQFPNKNLEGNYIYDSEKSLSQETPVLIHCFITSSKELSRVYDSFESDDTIVFDKLS